VSAPTTAALLDQIRQSLVGAALSYTSASAANDVYEGYLFALAVTTAARHRAVVWFETVAGRLTNDLVFRTSPGRIYSRTHDYTHAVLRLGAAPELEVHLGVRVVGKSGVLHECDLLILPKDTADQCRANSADPKSSACVLAVECKYYVSPMPLGMARGFIGLRTDVSPTTTFVANTGSPSVAKLLGARAAGQYELGLIPAATAQIDGFGQMVRNALRTYVSKHDPSFSI